MTVFFFVVGLEIKRELVRGELRDPRTASLPAIAAIGGMVVPALLYLTINTGGAGGRGWAIPMATDIAFAVAILAIAGSRVPRNLKLFLLTLAIVDDIGAIVVIAVFYSGDDLGDAGCSGAAAHRARDRRRSSASASDHVLAYVVPAFVLWVCVLESGVHATIAGVVLGLLTPARPIGGREVIEPIEARLHPWSSFLDRPAVRARERRRVPRRRGRQPARSTVPIAWGIVLGLVVGKPLGIVTAHRAGPPAPARPAARRRAPPPSPRRGRGRGHRLHRLALRRRPLVPGATPRRREGGRSSWRPC